MSPYTSDSNNGAWVARFFEARSEPHAESDFAQDATTSNSNPPPPSSSHDPSSLAIFAVIMGVIATLVLAFIGRKFLSRRRAHNSASMSTDISDAGVYIVSLDSATTERDSDNDKTPRALAVPKTPGVGWTPQIKSIRGPVYDPEKDAADIPLPPTPRTPYMPRSAPPRTPRSPHGLVVPVPPMPNLSPSSGAAEPASPPGYSADALALPIPSSP